MRFQSLQSSFTFILLLFSMASINAQTAAWGTCSGTDLQVLYSSNSLTYEFTNGNMALSNARLEVQLGTGIEYEAGGLVYTSSGSAVVTEGSATGANLVIFNIGAVAVNEVINITFPRTASKAFFSLLIKDESPFEA